MFHGRPNEGYARVSRSGIQGMHRRNQRRETRLETSVCKRPSVQKSVSKDRRESTDGLRVPKRHE